MAKTIQLIEKGWDTICPIDEDTNIALLHLLDAFLLARTSNSQIYPVGLAARRMWPFGRGINREYPLPGTRLVVWFEPPFHVPAQPEQIPSEWPQAIVHLLNRANGQAREILLTWEKQGRLPRS